MTHVALRNTIIFSFLVLFAPVFLFAQSLSVTVTPPLFQLTIGPGESWTSAIKIVNSNPYDVTYYASPVDFEAEGEKGQGKFVPLVEGTEATATLGQWIEISSDPVVVPKGTSVEVPFTVRIPANASPGGHYAAILVGTQAADTMIDGPSMKVSSFVSSLLFVRIKGEVMEKGRIREFITAESLYQKPQANFLLRFENTGNTHLRPRGDIRIYNMWGKERGKVDINQQNNFGNVLPSSLRKFEFAWEGEASAFEIGRYSAVATMSFGEDEKQTVTAKTYFWVVPMVPVSIALGSFVFFILLMTWFIRRYIRRALSLERERLGIPVDAPVAKESPVTIETWIEPLREGVVDLRSGRASVSASTSESAPNPIRQIRREPLTWFAFFQKYSLFFFFLMVIIAASIALWTYFENVLVPERTYEISDISSQDESIPSE